MAATREDVNEWIRNAYKEGFEFILSVCDTFEYDDYPVYFTTAQELIERYKQYDNSNMQKINEIIQIVEGGEVKEGLTIEDVIKHLTIDRHHEIVDVEPKELELRMYFLVPYNISPIQQAIQAGHAALEYANKYGQTQLFKDFVNKHKTWIILNGGTTNDSLETPGTLQVILNSLQTLSDFDYSTFKEPDLNNATTAICFICDERVWNTKTFPNFDEDLYQDKI